MSETFYPCDICCEVRVPGIINQAPTDTDLDRAGCDIRSNCHYWQLRTQVTELEAKVAQLQKQNIDYEGQIVQNDRIIENQRQLVDFAEAKLETLESHLLALATCPCCEETKVCHEDCTFQHDDPCGHAEMMLTRSILYTKEDSQ